MAGAGPSFADDLDCVNFFDQIDDLLDFPDESCKNNGESGILCEDFKDFPSVWTQSDPFPASESVFSGSNSNSTSDLSAELSVPYEDIAELEWLSTFVEDSFSAGNSLTIDVTNSVSNKVVSPSPNQFQTSSPVSVLESSSSSYGGGKVMPVIPFKPAAMTGGRCGRARSKRPRPSTFNPRPSMQLMSPNASFTKTATPFEGVRTGCAEFNSFSELGHSLKIPKSSASMECKKKKKMKLSVPRPAEVNQNENPNPLSPQVAVRKCQHCEITKTPQWRAGPMGPKTLCNACGVRFKSGRLFPEYRPAASPTFVPSVHSNSHKKVLEMRVKTCNRTGSPPSFETLQTELVPNENNVADYV
uniref:GATA transcription factor n=1 Tax=Kalanchoe fedtschenkoi TaxID=63787 RepID=A0A7N0V6C2_KALFE